MFRSMLERLAQSPSAGEVAIGHDCALVTIAQETVSLTYFPSTGLVLAACDVARLPEGDCSGLLRMLLEAQFGFAETSGATFSVNPDNQRICLSALLPMQVLDAGLLEAVVRNIASTAIRWQERCSHWNPAQAEPQAGGQHPQNALPV